MKGDNGIVSGLRECANFEELQTLKAARLLRKRGLSSISIEEALTDDHNGINDIIQKHSTTIKSRP